jgi:hypothetical protein
VEIYTRRDLERLFRRSAVRFVERRIIFAPNDNLIARFGSLGKVLRAVLQVDGKDPLTGVRALPFLGGRKDINENSTGYPATHPSVPIGWVRF